MLLIKKIVTIYLIFFNCSKEEHFNESLQIYNSSSEYYTINTTRKNVYRANPRYKYHYLEFISIILYNNVYYYEFNIHKHLILFYIYLVTVYEQMCIGGRHTVSL